MAFCKYGYDRGQSDPDRHRDMGYQENHQRQEKGYKVLRHELPGLHRELYEYGDS